jgi:hypothetical protein
MLSGLLTDHNAKDEQRICIVTHCDINYAAKALSLIKSLTSYGYRDAIVLIGHDQETVLKFKKLNISQLNVYHISELESTFPELLIAKNNRSKLEYFYCVTPLLIKFIQKFFKSKIYVYLDSDIFFFSDFHEVDLEGNNYSAAITPHRFSLRNIHLEKNGKFNVGLIAFNSNKRSFSLLEWWSAKCLESTSGNSKYGVYGDQKYLDEFQNLDNTVKEINNPGCNAAPWNSSNAIKIESQIILLDGEIQSKLIYFHFSGLKRQRLINFLGFMPYQIKPSKNLKRLIYLPYLDSLKESEAQLEINRSFYRGPIGLRNLMNSLRNLMNSFRYFDFIIENPLKKH